MFNLEHPEIKDSNNDKNILLFVAQGDREFKSFKMTLDMKYIELALKAYERALQDETILTAEQKQLILDKYLVVRNIKNQSKHS